MKDTKYNGWTNYATWRVNLEVFDGWGVADVKTLMNCEPFDGYDLSIALREYVKDYVYEQFNDDMRMIQGWVYAFLDDVNWHEISDWMMELVKEEKESD
jgi:hypothetical protein